MHLSHVDNFMQDLDPPLPVWRSLSTNQGHSLENLTLSSGRF